MKNIIKITLLVVVAILVSCRENKLISCENANNEIIKEQINDTIEITKEEKQAMEDMETHYHTIYHFFIPEKPDAEIKVLDVVEDTIISLEQWRKNKK